MISDTIKSINLNMGPWLSLILVISIIFLFNHHVKKSRGSSVPGPAEGALLVNSCMYITCNLKCTCGWEASSSKFGSETSNFHVSPP